MRKHTRWVRAVAALAVVALALLGVGCGSSSSGGGKTTASNGDGKPCDVAGKKIQFVAPLKSNPTMQVMAAGFMQEAKRLGFDGQALMTDDADPQKVLALGQQALAQGTDGMVVPPYDPSLYPLIQQAAAKGVPVVTSHSSVPATENLGMIQDIHPDPQQYGAAAARAIGEQIGGRGVVAITQGSFNPIENAAADSFKAEMAADYPGVKVLKPQVEGFEPAAAIAKAVSILQSDKGIVAAYSTTGGGPATWAGAQDQTGRRLVIIGMDYTRPNLDLVRAGKVYALVAQPIYEENAQAVDAIRDKICGKTVKAEVGLPSPLVTSANVADYYALLDRTGT